MSARTSGTKGRKPTPRPATASSEKSESRKQVDQFFSNLLKMQIPMAPDEPPLDEPEQPPQYGAADAKAKPKAGKRK